MKKVSVIVASYNAENTIERCIESIINQTHENLEVLCVNDGSSDNTKKIISEYNKKDSRVKLIDQKENKGVTYTKNHGIKSATGDYITFVDSDDYIEPDMITKMLSFAEEKQLDLVRCDYNTFVNGIKKNTPLAFEKTTVLKDKNIFLNKLLSGEVPGYLQLLMIRKKIIEDNKLVIDKNLNFLEDLLFYTNLIKHSTKIGVMSNRLANYCINDNGLTFSLNYKKIISRIDGVIYYNKQVKNIVELNSDQNVFLNNSSFYMLNHSFFELYKTKNFKDISKYISLIEDIMDNCNSETLDRFTKESLKMLRRKKYTSLKMWYFIAKTYLKIKGLIK